MTAGYLVFRQVRAKQLSSAYYRVQTPRIFKLRERAELVSPLLQEYLHGLLQRDECFYCYHRGNHHLLCLQYARFRPKSVPRQWEGKLTHLTGGIGIDMANFCIFDRQS